VGRVHYRCAGRRVRLIEEPPEQPRLFTRVGRPGVLDTVPMDREGSIKLLSGILAVTPRLPGAACVGRHEHYDELPGRGPEHHERERVVRAVACCATCPARVRCPTVITSSTITVAVGVRRSSVRTRPRHRPWHP
jgi:hypothetical protein